MTLALIRLGETRYSAQWHPSDWRRWGWVTATLLPGWRCDVLALGPLQLRRWKEVLRG